MDAMSFVYHWRAHPGSRYMLTIITHRGQESFNVPVMGCVNPIARDRHNLEASQGVCISVRG